MIRRLIDARGTRFGVAVISVVAVGSIAGVAFAQDADVNSAGTDTSAAEQQTSTSDPTTSDSTTTSDPTTSSTAEDTTTTSGDTSTSGGEVPDSSYQTTTTSDALNALTRSSSVQPATADDTNTCKDWDGKVEPPGPGTITVTQTGTVTLVFVFSADKLTATWSASAPFTGEILVKAGPQAQTTTVNGETTGTVTGNVTTNPQGKTITQAISHICARGGGTVTTTTTTTTTSTTSTTSTSTTDTSSTTTSTPTGGTAGTTGSGGGGGGNEKAAGTTAKSAPAAAAQATQASGGLPFTGLHVPALILIALGMTVAGVLLRRKADGSV
jgi:hypothetical protein